MSSEIPFESPDFLPNFEPRKFVEFIGTGNFAQQLTEEANRRRVTPQVFSNALCKLGLLIGSYSGAKDEWIGIRRGTEVEVLDMMSDKYGMRQDEPTDGTTTSVVITDIVADSFMDLANRNAIGLDETVYRVFQCSMDAVVADSMGGQIVISEQGTTKRLRI